jgi:hypothetical protein
MRVSSSLSDWDNEAGVARLRDAGGEGAARLANAAKRSAAR